MRCCPRPVVQVAEPDRSQHGGPELSTFGCQRAFSRRRDELPKPCVPAPPQRLNAERERAEEQLF
eukprot:15462308-Alexandrium_andersonii.AAC.1